MTGVPKGTRDADDEPLFKRPSSDPTIQPDRVTPAVEGYFRIPAVWIGEKPDDVSILKLDPSIHHAAVIERDLCSGIKVRVQRDGTFLFDFSSWEHAPQMMIPGYRTPGPGIGHRVPTETQDASNKSEQYAVLRAQVMNVHQACMATAETLLKRRIAAMGLPLSAADALKGLTFDDCVSYRDFANVWSLARNALNNNSQAASRRVLESDVVDYSLDLLDRILVSGGPALVRMSEAAYLAACRYAEGRFGEGVTLAWGVCEQLISTAWDRALNERKGTGHMPKTRRKKLEERDYTVSVKTEFLELEGRIDHNLYQHLEEARKARNRWAHDMQQPNNAQASHSIRALEGLLRDIHGVQLSLALTGPGGGVPEWNIWIWEEAKNREELQIP